MFTLINKHSNIRNYPTRESCRDKPYFVATCVNMQEYLFMGQGLFSDEKGIPWRRKNDETKCTHIYVNVLRATYLHPNNMKYISIGKWTYWSIYCSMINKCKVQLWRCHSYNKELWWYGFWKYYMKCTLAYWCNSLYISVTVKWITPRACSGTLRPMADEGIGRLRDVTLWKLLMTMLRARATILLTSQFSW